MGQKLLMMCEVSVRIVLPAIRRELAKILHKEFGLSQTKIAKILGVSQSAISHYLKDLRGKTLELRKYEDIMNEIREFAKLLVKGADLKTQVKYYCKICSMIFLKGLVCKAHKAYVKGITTKLCELCKERARKILEFYSQ